MRATRYLLKLGADPHDGRGTTSSWMVWLPLTYAASNGNSECVRLLLEGDADPNSAGPNGIDTALRYAVVNNFPETCRVLLENGADPNHPLIQPPILSELISHNFEGYQVPAADKMRLVRLLVEHKTLVDARDQNGGTALMRATESRDTSVVSLLLNLGALVDVSSNDLETPLHTAAPSGSKPILDLILARNPELNCKNDYGSTLLYCAVKFPELARALLEKGANPNLAQKGSFTLLMRASEGHPDSVKLLLEYGADINAATNGWTAVMLATAQGHVDCLQLLLDAGADPSHKTEWGQTPIHLVSKIECARTLLKHRKNFDFDKPEKTGTTALLHAALDFCDAEAIKLLINSGANINARAKDGDTPLLAAGQINDHNTVKLLVKESDCEVAVERRPWGGPLHIAAAYSDIDMVKLLVEGGADVNHVGTGLYGNPL